VHESPVLVVGPFVGRHDVGRHEARPPVGRWEALGEDHRLAGVALVPAGVDGGTVALDYQDRGCTATVGLSGNAFDAFNDSPALAVAVAFTQALLAEPKQVSLFGGDGTLPHETRSKLEELKRKRDQERSCDSKDEPKA